MEEAVDLGNREGGGRDWEEGVEEGETVVQVYWKQSKKYFPGHFITVKEAYLIELSCFRDYEG